MFPGMNPRKMQQAMKQMGIQQEEIDAKEVIIRTDDKDIIISNPQVVKVNMMGQDSFQISGHITERKTSSEPEISEEDIETVVEQTGCTEDEAVKAIKENDYDLAAAIMALKKQ
jgi:nascent polypeptide-associated complex subunit alpha